jgi:hypothetical protein
LPEYVFGVAASALCGRPPPFLAASLLLLLAFCESHQAERISLAQDFLLESDDPVVKCAAGGLFEEVCMDQGIEFSLMGLAGLLAEHGFRVVAGGEKTDGRGELIQRPDKDRPGVARVFKVKQITLTGALETPEEAVVT